MANQVDHELMRARPGSSRFWIACICAAAGVALLLIELGARWLGFGDPPLAHRDAVVEYRLVPSQTYHRFGNVVSINRYGMRSQDFDTRSVEPDKHVLLVGDSIVYGEHRLDQSQTLAALWQARLRERRAGQGWLVSAAAASSWGPANQLGFLRELGPLPADTAVLVVSSHDLWDKPSGRDVDNPYREAKPWGAFHDVFVALCEQRAASGEIAPRAVDPSELPVLAELIKSLAVAHERVLVVFHAASDELEGPSVLQAERWIAVAAAEGGASFASTRAPYLDARRHGIALYRDGLHLTAEGNRVLMQWLDEWLADDESPR